MRAWSLCEWGVDALSPLKQIQEIFDTVDLGKREWQLIGVLTLVPAVVEEITKLFYRLTGYGLRTQKIYTGQKSVEQKKKD